MSAVTYNGNSPVDPHLNGFRPPGLVTQDLRLREEAAERERWRIHDVQWQVFHRLREFSVNHAGQAWLHRYRKPLAPYALAYLFTQPVPNSTPSTARITAVHAATRIWKVGPESRAPLPLLATQIRQVQSRDPREPWDLRQRLANRADKGMAEDAVYLGLGLSNLDTSTGTWAQVCQNVTTQTRFPGTILYVCGTPSDVCAEPIRASHRGTHDADREFRAVADQQIIVAERRGADDGNLVTIHTYQGLSRYRDNSPYAFANETLTYHYKESGQGPLLWTMRELDLLLREADQRRRSMNPAADGRRRLS